MLLSALSVSRLALKAHLFPEILREQLVTEVKKIALDILSSRPRNQEGTQAFNIRHLKIGFRSDAFKDIT
jgi:hypothetical protein